MNGLVSGDIFKYVFTQPLRKTRVEFLCVVVYVIDFVFVESESNLLSSNYVNFWTNNLKKKAWAVLSTSYRLNSSSIRLALTLDKPESLICL